MSEQYKSTTDEKMANRHTPNEDLKNKDKETGKTPSKTQGRNKLDFLPTTEHNLSNMVLN